MMSKREKLKRAGRLSTRWRPGDMRNVVMGMRRPRGGRRGERPQLAYARPHSATSLTAPLLDRSPTFLSNAQGTSTKRTSYIKGPKCYYTQGCIYVLQPLTRTSGAMRSSTVCSFEPQAASLSASCPICSLESTRGCTHVICAFWSTWSREPLISFRLQRVT